VHIVYAFQSGTHSLYTFFFYFCIIYLEFEVIFFLQTGLDGYDKVLKLFSIARAEFGETLSSFELLDNTAVTYVESKLHLPCPITNVHPFYVLIELSSSQPTVGQHMENVLEKALGDSVISDATTTDQMSSIHVITINFFYIKPFS